MNPVQGSVGHSIRTLSSREVYRNHWMRLREDHILRSNGEKGIYSVVDKDDSAIILPIAGDRIWLVEQFRYTFRSGRWNCPRAAGKGKSTTPGNWREVSSARNWAWMRPR